MSLYFPPSLRVDFEPRLGGQSTWQDHAAFGYDLVAATAPRLLVELGSQRGFSFAVFCQSAREHSLDCTCYAVDTWAGDEHTGSYGEEIYDRLASHIREFYRHYAYLLRMTFDEAVAQFSDGSIDLLHIDGLHTYEAVAHDFHTWYPKVATGGIILFHDIAERQGDFGVWKLWEELQQQYPCFTFTHGHGLGVLRKPGGAALQEQARLIQLLFGDSAEDRQVLAEMYSIAGQFLKSRRQARKFRESREQAIKRKMTQQA
ncbi:class I SAM-dependent methyltransferase [Seongchinamella sediminis]|uniref:Class I SAM-dependent methyltransferase n=1 Tax=Seongchinamella sediminis TaxID=2283635 RepID=A0A3L7DYU0_9GAMM|nr:class I SAM-dependent methyltransferase [Seongchinamella sediminis]RLQ21161.1 class I SAM-dependent methyltransferase [Seongchinamella sediminis]